MAQVEYCLTMWLISLRSPGHYTDVLARRRHLWIPWFPLFLPTKVTTCWLNIVLCTCFSLTFSKTIFSTDFCTKYTCTVHVHVYLHLLDVSDSWPLCRVYWDRREQTWCIRKEGGMLYMYMYLCMIVKYFLLNDHTHMW